eukprot:175661-Chlamydomonas_euryale.AAC.4
MQCGGMVVVPGTFMELLFNFGGGGVLCAVLFTRDKKRLCGRACKAEPLDLPQLSSGRVRNEGGGGRVGVEGVQSRAARPPSVDGRLPCHLHGTALTRGDGAAACGGVERAQAPRLCRNR